MDPITITIVISIITIFIERLFDWTNKIRKSKCFELEVEMK